MSLKMPAQCEHYRVKTGSCGLLDKDDHTYSCDKLMLNNECPRKNDDPLAAFAEKAMRPFLENVSEMFTRATGY